MSDDVLGLVQEYLSNGGLFNPEIMDPEKVRDLVIRMRDEIIALRAREGVKTDA